MKRVRDEEISPHLNRCVFKNVPFSRMSTEMSNHVKQAQICHCIVEDGKSFLVYHTYYDQCICFIRIGFRSLKKCLNYFRHYLDESSIPLDRGKVWWNKEEANALAREAIHWWTLCARRLGVVKDIRRKIGQELLDCQHLWI